MQICDGAIVFSDHVYDEIAGSWLPNDLAYFFDPSDGSWQEIPWTALAANDFFTNIGQIGSTAYFISMSQGGVCSTVPVASELER